MHPTSERVIRPWQTVLHTLMAVMDDLNLGFELPPGIGIGLRNCFAGHFGQQSANAKRAPGGLATAPVQLHCRCPLPTVRALSSVHGFSETNSLRHIGQAGRPRCAAYQVLRVSHARRKSFPRRNYRFGLSTHLNQQVSSRERSARPTLRECVGRIRIMGKRTLARLSLAQ